MLKLMNDDDDHDNDYDVDDDDDNGNDDDVDQDNEDDNDYDVDGNNDELTISMITIDENLSSSRFSVEATTRRLKPERGASKAVTVRQSANPVLKT